MLVFGHIGIAVFLATLVYLPTVFVLTGVLLPDIVDKIFMFSGLVVCGRFIGHSLVFGPVVAAIIYLVTRKKSLALAILFGSYLHLLEDMGYFMPWFYPFVNYSFDCKPWSLHVGWFEIATEGLGISLLAITITFNSKLIYYRDKLWRMFHG